MVKFLLSVIEDAGDLIKTGDLFQKINILTRKIVENINYFYDIYNSFIEEETEFLYDMYAKGCDLFVNNIILIMMLFLFVLTIFCLVAGFICSKIKPIK